MLCRARLSTTICRKIFNIIFENFAWNFESDKKRQLAFFKEKIVIECRKNEVAFYEEGNCVNIGNCNANTEWGMGE